VMGRRKPNPLVLFLCIYSDFPKKFPCRKSKAEFQGGKDWMATKMKENGVQTPSLEARFPIVATNLRALVSSWLPPAREPSPVDEEISANGESEGRQER